MSEDYSNKNVSILNVGNVLVDIEISISNKQLSEIPIQKGRAIEINSDELAFYLSKYKSQITNQYLGGSIFTTAATSSIFKINNLFLGSVGKDSNSKFLIDIMNTYPIKTFLNVDPQNTGCCLIFLTPDKERTMAACAGASGQLTLANFTETEDFDYIFSDLYSLNSVINKKTISHLLASNKGLILSLSDISVMKKHMDFIKKYSDQIKIIAGNEDEMKYLEQAMNSSLISASRNNNKLYIITKGSSGSLILHKGVEYVSEAIATKVRSLNGAGDTYLGAFIGCYMETEDIQYSGNVANYFSHVAVQQNNACLTLSNLQSTKNAAKAAFL